MQNDKNKSLNEELLEVQRTLGWMDLVLGSISDAVCVTDADDKLIFSNSSFAHLAESPRVFLLGEKFKDAIGLVPTENPLTDFSVNKTTLANSKHSDSGIFEITKKGKNKLIFRVSSRLLPNTEQRVYLFQDITHEYELARIKNDFINLASHQLRTPMTAISTYAYMLKEGFAGKLDKHNQKLADSVVESSQRMVFLVNNLLSITRIQSEQQIIKKECLSLQDIFNQIEAELKPRFEQKGLRFSINIPDDMPMLYNDTSVLHEIFSNLVVNSIQYTRPSGSISMNAKVRLGQAIVIVKDTGIGIPKKYQHLLFTQFGRADNALQEYPEGTGLGLYIIKILLDKVGGEISFQSRANKGTSFEIALPLRAN